MAGFTVLYFSRNDTVNVHIEDDESHSVTVNPVGFRAFPDDLGLIEYIQSLQSSYAGREVAFHESVASFFLAVAQIQRNQQPEPNAFYHVVVVASNAVIVPAVVTQMSLTQAP